MLKPMRDIKCHIRIKKTKTLCCNFSLQKYHMEKTDFSGTRQAETGKHVTKHTHTHTNVALRIKELHRLKYCVTEDRCYQKSF